MAKQKGANAPDPTPDAADLADDLTPADLFGMAWSDAIFARDHATGTLPATSLDAIAVAYRKVPPSKRATLVAQLAAQGMADAMADPAKPDVSLMVAIGQAQQAIATATVRPEKVTADPAIALAALLDVLATATDVAIASVDTDTFDRVVALRDGDDRTVDADRVAKVIRAAGASKRGSSTGSTGGPRAAGRDLAPLILAAVTTGGGFLPIADVKRACDSSGGAIDNRHAKNNVPGVVAVERDGVRGFAIA